MAGVSPNTRRRCEEVLAWQAKSKKQRIPNQHSDDAEEMRLGKRFTNLLLRRFRSIGTGRKPSEKQLNPDELALVNSVPGVPVRGCASTVTATSLSEVHSAAADGPSSASAPRLPRRKALGNRMPLNGVLHRECSCSASKKFSKRGRTMTASIQT